jgi:short-subunit dehydrogenase
VNKNIVIFGASQGIGKALAIEFGKCGYKLVLLSKNIEQLIKLSNELRSNNINCFYKKCDITIIEEVKEGINFAISSLGKIDIVLINSGVGGPNWVNEFSSNELKSKYEVNVFGIANVLEIIIPIFKKQGYGIIAGVTSLADVRGFAGSSSYSSSKAAASKLLEAARIELKKNNINVIIIRPGFVKTAMTAKNEFKMPFIMEPQKAAIKIRKGIEKGKKVIQFPLPISFSTKILKIMPNWLFDYIMEKARVIK